MKETFYFSHDVNARSDPKLIKVQMKLGMAGIGLFWCIVEMLYENSGVIHEDYELISFELRSDENTIKSVINDFGLFEISDGKITSNAVKKQLEFRADKSIKAKESINKRWNYDRNTNVLPQNNESNTIKESKGKEIKEKKNYVPLSRKNLPKDPEERRIWLELEKMCIETDARTRAQELNAIRKGIPA